MDKEDVGTLELRFTKKTTCASANRLSGWPFTSAAHSKLKNQKPETKKPDMVSMELSYESIQKNIQFCQRKIWWAPGHHQNW
ncbi:uncharacterized protein [Canis lupus baileyi]|uniref:uncharacterized protein isoform X5 n=1 Tax=Canis lupus baileyi TaxID=143281 RepID=UPI003B96FFB3